ncbi:MAG: succinylglutamate desuccinylase, partial [Haliea sp.]
LRNPIRLELNPGIELAYAEQPDAAYPVVLRPDIEQLNFGVVQPDVPLGWVRGELRSLFWAQDASGRCAVSRLLRVADGRLYPAAPLKLFMITTNTAIARSDCLLYAIEQDELADVS